MIVPDLHNALPTGKMAFLQLPVYETSPGVYGINPMSSQTQDAYCATLCAKNTLSHLHIPPKLTSLRDEGVLAA